MAAMRSATSALLRLDVDGGGGRARGRVVGDAVFMVLRDQRAGRAALPAELRKHGDVTTSRTGLHPWSVAGDPHAATAIGFRLPGIAQFFRPAPDGGRLVVVERGGDSWARVRLGDTAPYQVEQGGPRRLWDEVDTAYRGWRERGELPREGWQVTVGPEGQHVELHPPDTDAEPRARCGRNGPRA